MKRVWSVLGGLTLILGVCAFVSVNKSDSSVGRLLDRGTPDAVATAASTTTTTIPQVLVVGNAVNAYLQSYTGTYTNDGRMLNSQPVWYRWTGLTTNWLWYQILDPAMTAVPSWCLGTGVVPPGSALSITNASADILSWPFTWPGQGTARVTYATSP